MVATTKYILVTVAALSALTCCKPKENGTASTSSQSTSTPAMDTSSSETSISIDTIVPSTSTTTTNTDVQSTNAPAKNANGSSKSTSQPATSTDKPNTSKGSQAGNTEAQVSYTGEQTIVYKTKADYSKYVPVTLNAEKTAVVAYPGPTDVYRNGKLAYPTPLVNGYYIDNRGIGLNSAFLNITYDDYIKLKEAPPLTDMIGKLLLEKNPFTEIYNIGSRSRFTNEQAEINEIINKGGLKKFKKLK